MSELLTLRQWLGRDEGNIALVFTDIVRSTAIGLGMGDDEWIKKLKKHFAKARLHKGSNGYEVKLIGDSCMMAFHTPDIALRFCLAFFNDTGDDIISIRAAIHEGGVQVVENDVYGLMVNYTSRIQHAMKGCGIAISAGAKAKIETKLGPNFGDLGKLGKVVRLLHSGIPDYGDAKHEVWQFVTPEIAARRRALKTGGTQPAKSPPPQAPPRTLRRLATETSSEDKPRWAKFLLAPRRKPD